MSLFISPTLELPGSNKGQSSFHLLSRDLDRMIARAMKRRSLYSWALSLCLVELDYVISHPVLHIFAIVSAAHPSSCDVTPDSPHWQDEWLPTHCKGVKATAPRGMRPSLNFTHNLACYDLENERLLRDDRAVIVPQFRQPIISPLERIPSCSPPTLIFRNGMPLHCRNSMPFHMLWLTDRYESIVPVFIANTISSLNHGNYCTIAHC